MSAARRRGVREGKDKEGCQGGKKKGCQEGEGKKGEKKGCQGCEKMC